MKGNRLCAVLVLLLTTGCRRNPELREIASVDTPGWAHDLGFLGKSLYVSDRQGGFAVFDLRDFLIPPRTAVPVTDVISLSPNTGNPLLAARFQGIVLVTSSGQVLDRQVYVGDIANAVETRGGWAYAAYGLHGLVVYRIDGSSLRAVSGLPTPGWSHNIRLIGERAVLADWDYGLRVVDISHPEAPREIGSLRTPATTIALDLHQQGGRLLAAVAEGHAGVAIAEIDVGGHPALVSRVGLGLRLDDVPHPETGGWVHGVAWSGRYIFAANWKRGLAVIDAGDVRAPRLILEHATPGTALAVAAQTQADGSHRIYLADGESGLRVFDFSRK
jgi:hypothetical protein